MSDAQHVWGLILAGGEGSRLRACIIVAQQHRRWWSAMDRLGRLPQRNLIVPPRNRGTAIGILYSLLHILGQDPEARVVVLRADHYVADEDLLGESLSTALEMQVVVSRALSAEAGGAGWPAIVDMYTRLPDLGRPRPDLTPLAPAAAAGISLAAQHARLEHAMRLGARV